MLPLSQGQLTLLDTCSRKFKHVFFDALSSPSSYEQKAKTQWGSQFHLLMQQRSLDLPIEVMADADAEMMRRISALNGALAEAAPEVFEHLPITAETTAAEDVFVQSEQRRTVAFGDYLLTAIYDLVVEAPDKGQIFDWKTHQQPPRKEWLQHNWQTRLYLYMLAETTVLAPEQLSMTYCFVRTEVRTDGQTEVRAEESHPTQDTPPSFYRFDYSTAQHWQTHQDLQAMTERLTKAIALLDAGKADAAFPKVAEEKGLCDRCPFAIRCDRAQAAFPTASPTADPYQLLRQAQQITAETVEEIPL